MRKSSDGNSPRDREIARHFAAMREEDSRQAPAIPSADSLTRRRPRTVARRYSPVLPRVAAGMVLALLAGLLTLDWSPADPGDLYADIMGENPLMTDTLLSVSPGLSPEMIDTMGFLEIDVPVMEVN